MEVRAANFEGNLVVKSSKGRNDNTRTYKYLFSKREVTSETLIWEELEVLPAVQHLLLYDHALLPQIRRVLIGRHTQVFGNGLRKFIKTSTESYNVGDDLLYVKFALCYDMNVVLIR